MKAVVFDVGETLYSEERSWAAWAQWVGVAPWTLAAALGATIERRDHHLTAIDVIRPGFDLRAEQAERDAAGVPDDPVALYDLAPGAADCVATLREAGLRIGVAANQPAAVAPLLEDLLEPGELMGISEAWGVSKPAPEFFTRIAAELGLSPGEIAYVGDRVDNDVVPAADAGMVAVHLASGPWGLLQASWPDAARAAIRAASLTDVANALVGYMSSA